MVTTPLTTNLASPPPVFLALNQHLACSCGLKHLGSRLWSSARSCIAFAGSWHLSKTTEVSIQLCGSYSGSPVLLGAFQVAKSVCYPSHASRSEPLVRAQHLFNCPFSNLLGFEVNSVQKSGLFHGVVIAVTPSLYRQLCRRLRKLRGWTAGVARWARAARFHLATWWTRLSESP